MSVAALVLAAGRGVRLGGPLPKAFALLAGVPLLVRALEALAASPEIDLLQPVLAREDLPRWANLEAVLSGISKLRQPVEGGAERQDSMRAGIAALPPEVEWVAVHDAARPLITPEAVTRVVRVARQTGAAILALPVRDTVKRVRGGRVLETPARDECYAAQTPQVFRVEILREALEKAAAEGFLGTDDSQIVERLGVSVAVVEAGASNLKLTVSEDWIAAERWLEQRRREGGGRMRIGQGLDAHRLVPGRALMLGGVDIPFERGLEGHSDGDVLLHAVASALLGALGEGDLGAHFPSSDPALAGIASSDLLLNVATRVRERGFELANLDATLIAQAPRLAGYLDKMRSVIADILGVSAERINIKVTSTDRLGAIGRGEGIAAQAVVLLEGPAR